MNPCHLKITQVFAIFEYRAKYMSDLEILEKTGTDAVKRLRKQKLASGKPFMINSKDLSATQSYLEYPDGSISIVTVAPDSRSFITVRKLTADEAQSVLRQHDLL
jgi:hydrogenase maturation factor HypF (carbamoyltransferase family)